MKALVVEDDFTSSKILQRLLVSNFETDVAVDGIEAINAFKTAHEKDASYDVIFLDIMMPKKDGHQVLKDIRAFENLHKIDNDGAAKIIMTTALDDSKNVLSAAADLHRYKPAALLTDFHHMYSQLSFLCCHRHLKRSL